MRSENTFKIISVKDDEYIILDGLNGNFIKVNEIVKNIFELISDNKRYQLSSDDLNKIITLDFNRLGFNVQDLNETIEKVKKYMERTLEPKNISEVYKMLNDNYGYTSICLNIAEKCNLNCKYCFGKGGNYGNIDSLMEQDTAQKLLNHWFENLDSNANEFYVTFFGGEPTLNVEVIKFVIDYINSYRNDIAKKVTYIITTNGTNITPEFIEILKNNRFKVSVSVDGIEFIHRYNRPYKDNTNSYQNVINNIFKIKKHVRDLSVQITLFKEDIKYLSKSVLNLWELGINNVYSNLVFSKNYNYEYLYIKEYEKQMKILSKEMLKNIKNNKKLFFGNVFDMARNIYLKNFNKSCYLWTNKTVIFSANGDRFRCYRGIGDDNFKDNYNKCRYIPLEKTNIKKCDNCYMQLFCGDGCPYENYIGNNDINEPSIDFCNKNEALFETSLFFLYDIVENNLESCFS